MIPARVALPLVASLMLAMAAACGGPDEASGGGDDENRDAEFEQWLEEDGTHDALTWLGDPNHVLFEGEKSEVTALVERFRSAGSPNVWIVGASRLDDEEGGSPVELAAAILVRIPASGAAREQVFAVHDDWAKAAGYDPEKDRGQKYLHVAFD